jgi:hypothetical protein
MREPENFIDGGKSLMHEARKRNVEQKSLSREALSLIVEVTAVHA